MTDNPQDLEIDRLISQRNWGELRASLANRPAPELADLLLSLGKYDRVLVFRVLPRDLSAEVFSHLDPRDQDDLLKDLTDEETRQLLANMQPDDRTHLLEELPGQATQRLLNLLSTEDLVEARLLLGYPEDSAGRLMTPDYVAVRPDWTIGQALEHVRTKGKGVEAIEVIYVTDASWKLIDALGLGRFVLANPKEQVEQIMDRSFISVVASEDRERAVELMQEYDLFVLPVVNTEGILLGVVTVDDVFDVAQEEVTEDFQKVGAVSPLRISYREASIWSLYQKRIVWLIILVLVALTSSAVIAAFEATLEAVIALAFFIPLLIGSGGNTGAQSATLMIRALATGDVDPGQWSQILIKELGVGAALGITMGLASWVLGVFRGGFEIGLVVGLTMLSLVMVANIIGMLLPFVLTHLRLDPAVASSPLISSIADAVGLLIYFSTAIWLLTRFGAM